MRRQEEGACTSTDLHKTETMLKEGKAEIDTNYENLEVLSDISTNVLIQTAQENVHT